MVGDNAQAFVLLAEPVMFNSRHQIVVGHLAKGQLLSNPANTVHGAKRLVGRPFHAPVVQELEYAASDGTTFSGTRSFQSVRSEGIL